VILYRGQQFFKTSYGQSSRVVRLELILTQSLLFPSWLACRCNAHFLNIPATRARTEVVVRLSEVALVAGPDSFVAVTTRVLPPSCGPVICFFTVPEGIEERVYRANDVMALQRVYARCEVLQVENMIDLVGVACGGFYLSQSTHGSYSRIVASLKLGGFQAASLTRPVYAKAVSEGGPDQSVIEAKDTYSVRLLLVARSKCVR
jgi:hypothetical protein